jgi:tetratricopeptide (TPR) repeat protein
VLPIILAFAAIDVLLVRIARQHRSAIGRRLYLRAQSASSAGNAHEAVELFRAAHNQDPSNPDYHLGFVRALRSVGREREAIGAVRDLLRRLPADGLANVEMARLLVPSGDWRQAAWFYHRALYGNWSDSPDLRGLRFELADLLAEHGARAELLAELLLLDASSADEPELRRLGTLLLKAEAWSRAEELYRGLLRHNPSDAELWTGLGRAQLAAATYAAAERSFRRAIRLGASERAVGRELQLVMRLEEVDPTARRLSARERHKRAHQLAASLLDSMRGCSANVAAVRAADTALRSHSASAGTLSATESDFDVVERLWTSRETICRPVPPIPEEVARLAEKVSK